VSEVYSRPYCLQQQDGCLSRQLMYITVPMEDEEEDLDIHESIVELLSGSDTDMCVTLDAWLKRDPKLPPALEFQRAQYSDYTAVLWYHRNFYPPLYQVVNDLHKKGLLEVGEYIINIDW